MAIDRQKIIAELSKIELNYNENGLIEKFNILANKMPTAFWNIFAVRMVEKAEPDLREATEYLLYNAAHECGYHTGYGIINSQEWKTVVAPMVEKSPEDVLYGAFAVLAAWGWADAEIVELLPGKKMVVRAYKYYESDMLQYGNLGRPCAYMLAGVSAAFMELAYAGDYDPSGKPIGTFYTKQIKGIECGDSYGEFVVTLA
jgi:hypothetical protein